MGWIDGCVHPTDVLGLAIGVTEVARYKDMSVRLQILYELLTSWS
jgi:hypothetical protein